MINYSELGLTKESDAVYRISDSIEIGQSHLKFLKEILTELSLPRVRICLHEGNSSPVQEMIVCLRKGSYIRPHSHMSRAESGHVIEGNADLIFFNNCGDPTERIRFGLKNNFHYRIPAGIIHTQIIHSDVFIFKEVLPGPFTRDDTFFPEWAPGETDFTQISLFNKRFTDVSGV